MPASPGELGALGFGGPELAYAADDANARPCPVKAAVPEAAARRPSRDLTFWAQGLGGWGHTDSDGNAASLTSRFGGFLSGADARFGDTLRAGLVAGYLRSDLNVDARASSAGIDSVQIGAYAAGRLGAFNLRGGASCSFDSIDTSRGIFFPGFTDQTKASFHGNVGQVFGEVGYGMALGHVAVEPLAGLAYVHVRDGSFLESGGAAALSGASANENIGYSWLGVRAATAVPLANGTVLVPRASLQWQHAFGDVTPARRSPSRPRARRSRLRASRSRAIRRWSKPASTGASARGRGSGLSIRASLPRTPRPTPSRAPSPGAFDAPRVEDGRDEPGHDICALRYVPRCDRHAVMAHPVLVDVDSQSRPIKDVHVASGGRNCGDRNIFGQPGMGERQRPADIGDDGCNVERRCTGDARFARLARDVHAHAEAVAQLAGLGHGADAAELDGLEADAARGLSVVVTADVVERMNAFVGADRDIGCGAPPSPCPRDRRPPPAARRNRGPSRSTART